MKLIECPRDAMQGLSNFIPTTAKIQYMNKLLKVGFDTLDFGSFVSPKAIPQMSDTAEVLSKLDLSETQTKLLVIIANIKGALQACEHQPIDYLGYPLSISETFQQRNTNRSIATAFEDLKHIKDVCDRNKKELVVYLSMAFGNPYHDRYHTDALISFIDRLHLLEIRIISLADTVGVATIPQIGESFHKIVPLYPDIEFGAHLHTKPENALEKMIALHQFNCKRIDGVIQGKGGCPMTGDPLVGNMPTEIMFNYFEEQGITTGLNKKLLNEIVFSDFLF